MLQGRHARLIVSTAPGIERSLAELEARIAALAAERDALLSPQKVQATTLQQVVERWNSGEEARRLMVREAFRLIEIEPFDGRGPRRFDHNRVRATFADQVDEPGGAERAA